MTEMSNLSCHLTCTLFFTSSGAVLLWAHARLIAVVCPAVCPTISAAYVSKCISPLDIAAHFLWQRCERVFFDIHIFNQDTLKLEHNTAISAVVKKTSLWPVRHSAGAWFYHGSLFSLHWLWMANILLMNTVWPACWDEVAVCCGNELPLQENRLPLYVHRCCGPSVLTLTTTVSQIKHNLCIVYVESLSCDCSCQARPACELACGNM